jgi:hypothetical protein
LHETSEHRLGVMPPLTAAKLCIRHFPVWRLVERRAITGHPARDLLLYCLLLLGQALQRRRLDREAF